MSVFCPRKIPFLYKLYENCGGDQPKGGGDGDPGYQAHQHVPGDQHDSWYEIYNSLVMLCDHIFIA